MSLSEPTPTPHSLNKQSLKFSETDARTSGDLSQPVYGPNEQTGKEGFELTSVNMNDDIRAGAPLNMKLYDEYTAFNRVNSDLIGKIPNTYGYIATTQEVHNNDVTELIRQENTTLALTLLSGISIVILGTMLLSRGSVAPST